MPRKKTKIVTAIIGDFLDGSKKWKYMQHVKACGSEVVIAETQEEAMECSHLLVMGGGDCHPQFYGEIPMDENKKYDVDLDIMELLTIMEFTRKKKPVLGICRGMQMINISLLGSLCQDMKTKLDIDHPNPHRVRISKSSGLHGKIDEVNSFHHQCIADLGGGLQVTGKAPDGIIEMIEGIEMPILGVQWHPERFDTNEVFEYFYKTKKRPW